jgi:hypothetical protein
MVEVLFNSSEFVQGCVCDSYEPAPASCDSAYDN